MKFGIGSKMRKKFIFIKSVKLKILQVFMFDEAESDKNDCKRFVI